MKSKSLIRIILLVLTIVILFTGILFGIQYAQSKKAGTKTASTNSSSSSVRALSSTSNALDTSSGFKQAKWGDNVTISYNENYLEYKSNGLPNHERPKQYALPNANNGNKIPTAAAAFAGDDPSQAQNYDFKISSHPSVATKATPTSLGTIGVMISGAALFNPYEADNSTIATASNFTVTDKDGNQVAFLDSCNGHPSPMGAYHYHALPTCITSKIDQTSGPSHILGIAFDGFPIYGDKDMNGTQINANQLDSCNGINSKTPEFPSGIYHYVLLNAKDSSSSIRCFAGTVDSSLIQQMPRMGRR